ncbi:MAG TPA: nucleotide-binding protein [Micromonosporaceae bacterium]|nr:nucleotide-binding protein [Micromonosporaceae bacterium]
MSSALVFDTGPLSHFAEAGWLKILQALAGDRAVLVPDLVRDEIAGATHMYPFLGQVLSSDWIRIDRSDDIELLVAQARYASRLASGRKNLGECSVLALAEVRCHVAVLDDRVARKVGEEYGVQITGTLALLCDGIRKGLLTVPLVSKIADDLLATEYRLPLLPGQFEIWALQEGLI